MEIVKYEEKYSSKCNELLTKLINDERNYDESLKENIIINNYYNKLNDDEIIYVALIDNEVVGYIYGFIIKDELIINKKAKLDALYIEQDYRNNLLATKLIDRFKDWCKEKNITQVEVQAFNENKKATSLYLKENFKPQKTTYSFKIK